MSSRALAFFTVGAIGFAVQASMLMLLTEGGWSVAAATAVAVECAILVNFLWHERWTWRDRRVTRIEMRARRLLRFHATNGIASLGGSVSLTWLAVHFLGVHPLIANGLSVVVMAAVNYRSADRWVFRAAVIAACLTLAPSGASAAELKDNTLAAWNAHVIEVERSLDLDVTEQLQEEPRGRTLDVPSGTISEWRGSILIPNRTVSEVVDTLVSSPTLPAPQEVTASKIISRDGDALHTYMRLVRHSVVTATYDTEHDVRYTRRSATLATSRSVATRIAEVGGSDRGFLWRLNSYWRYRQVGNDVRIDVLSLTLSRSTPWMLKPIAGPIVDRIGRESMRSTLTAVAHFLEGNVPASVRSPVPRPARATAAQAHAQ